MSSDEKSDQAKRVQEQLLTQLDNENPNVEFDLNACLQDIGGFGLY